MDFLVSAATNKRVLHLGCADAPYYEEHFRNGQLLHALLCKTAQSVAGVDLDVDGIEFLKSKGFANLHVADVEQLQMVNLGEAFDVIVAGELIEHVGNPVMALRALRGKLATDGLLLLSVPNAFSLKSFLRVLTGVELVHPDHLYYFSHTTLRTLLGRAALGVERMEPYVSRSSRPVLGAIDMTCFGAARYLSPWISDGLIVAARAV